MNAIVAGKQEKVAGSMVWENFRSHGFYTTSSRQYVDNVSVSDWIRLIDKENKISAILPISSIWPKSTTITASATRLYPIHNDLTWYIMLLWENNILGIYSSYNDVDHRISLIYNRVDIGTLKQ